MFLFQKDPTLVNKILGQPGSLGLPSSARACSFLMSTSTRFPMGGQCEDLKGAAGGHLKLALVLSKAACETFFVESFGGDLTSASSTLIQKGLQNRAGETAGEIFDALGAEEAADTFEGRSASFGSAMLGWIQCTA